MENIVQTFFNLIDGPKLLSLMGLIVLDTLLGIAVAIKNHAFIWSKLVDFLDTSVMPLVVGYFAVGAFAVFEPSFALTVPITWGLIDAKLIADVISKLKDLGVPIGQKKPVDNLPQPPA